MSTKRPVRVDQNPSEQDILNRSFDPVGETLVVQLMGTTDNTNYYKLGVNSSGQFVLGASNQAKKIREVGDVTYIGVAAVGSAESAAVWQAKKIDASVSGITRITWADGNDFFDNIATDLTALSYS